MIHQAGIDRLFEFQGLQKAMREGRLQTVFNWTIDVASHDDQPQITMGCIYVRGKWRRKSALCRRSRHYGDHTLDDSSTRFFEYRVPATISHSGLEFRYKYERGKEKL